MTVFVLDASALLRTYLGDGPQRSEVEDAFAAVEAGTAAFLAPGHFWAEVGHALLRQVGRAALSPAEAEELLEALLALPIRLESTASGVLRASQIALAQGITVYDALYAELAERRAARLLTYDRSLDAVVPRPATPAAGPAGDRPAPPTGPTGHPKDRAFTDAQRRAVDAALTDLGVSFAKVSQAKRRVSSVGRGILLHIATKAAPEDKSTEEDWFFGVTRKPLHDAVVSGAGAAVIACCGGSSPAHFILGLSGPVGDLLLNAPVQANDQIKFNIVRRRDTGQWQLWANGPRLDLRPPRPVQAGLAELFREQV